jgi:hypothetical protein
LIFEVELMAQSQFSKVTDLSRLNWKGWVLLLITVGLMLTGIISALNDGATHGMDQRNARKVVGFLCAFAALGGFIVIAAILHQLGISIYRSGVDPWEHGFVQDPGDVTASFGTAKTSSDAVEAGELSSDATTVVPKTAKGETLKDLGDLM